MRDFARRLFRIRPRARTAIEAEFRAEIAAHLALVADYYVRQGFSPNDAERLAQERFGDLDRAIQALTRSAVSREVVIQRREWWDVGVQNPRLAARQLRRSPSITLGVAFTLALGIGANLVMFNYVDRLLLSPPPGVARADEVRRVLLPQYNSFDRSTISSPITNYAAYLDLGRGAGFAGLGAYGFPQDASLGRGRDATLITVNGASASFFTVLGAKPLLGRFYSAAEDVPPRGSAVTVISYSLWKRAFAGERSVLGRSIIIDGASYVIVGVAAPRFNGIDLQRVDAWLPMTTVSSHMSEEYVTDRGSLWMMVVGRLVAGVDERTVISQASAAILHANQRVAKANPHARIELGSVIGARSGSSRSEAALALLLLGVTAAVLLIACANVTNLLLTRATQRQREIAIRVALGVSKLRLLGELFIEGMTIALIAVGAAITGAFAAGIGVRALLPDQLSLDPTSPRTIVAATLLFVLIIMIVTLTPAAYSLRVDVASALKANSRTVSDARFRLRGGLLLVQVALSSMLLVGAGLFVRSLQKAESTRIGLDPDRVLLAQVDLSSSGTVVDAGAPAQSQIDASRRDAFWQRARDQVARLPRVTEAALSIGAPLRFSISGTFRIPGRDSIPTLNAGGPYRYGVDEHFFAATGARIIRGRAFTAADTRAAQHVAIVDETLARLWPNADPIGACVRVARADTVPCATIVGVVEDVHRELLREGPAYQYYVPYAQWPGPRSPALLVRVDRPANSADLDRVRRTLEDVAPDLPFPSVQSYADILAPQLQSWKAGALILSLCGLLALVVSVVGLYSVLAFSVAQRRFELGIRAALGAGTSDLVVLVVRRAGMLVLAGLALGLAAAAISSRVAAPLLLDVSPYDKATYVIVCATALLVSALATTIPARRAAAANPMQALRAE